MNFFRDAKTHPRGSEKTQRIGCALGDEMRRASASNMLRKLPIGTNVFGEKN
jgi:hypothetical protein